jgi:hypothetical protein
VLVLYGGQGFVDLGTPTAMLGAMYGDFSFSVPFNTGQGRYDPNLITTGFSLGEGHMVRGDGKPRNTRISALVALHNYNAQALAIKRYLNREDGRPKRDRIHDVYNEVVSFPEEHRLGVSVWENAFASSRLPRDLFRRNG